MKKIVLVFAALLAFAAPVAFAAEHGGHGGGTHDKGHGGHQGDVAHEAVVDGVKATFRIMGMKEHMKAMNMELPKGVKETHHIAVEFKDVKNGKTITEGETTVKVVGPDKVEQIKELLGMQGHFGADFELAKKGKYGVMCKFVLKDGKIRSSKFWHVIN